MNFLTLDRDVFAWILHVSWQAAVLAALVLAAQFVFKQKLAPAWRYGLWLVVVVRLLVPISLPSAFSIFNLGRAVSFRPEALRAVVPGPVAADPAIPDHSFSLSTAPSDNSTPPDTFLSSATASVAHQADTQNPTDWFRIASLTWLGGVCLLGLHLLWANLVFRLRLARHTPVSDQRIINLICECSRAMGVKQPISVLETKAVRSPAVYGLWRKWLLLPDGIFERFSDAELHHVFTHEFAHLKRRDLEMNWLVTMLQILHWFNPVLWLAFARMRADRELATDALALAGEPASENVPYGETILKLLEGLARTATQPGLVGIAESKARLKERLREIATRGRAKPWRWAAIGLAAVLIGIGLTDAQQSKPGSPTSQHPDVAPEKTVVTNEDPNVQSNHALLIAGNVLNAENKKPVKHFRIDWMDRDDPEGFASHSFFNSQPESDGFFSLNLGLLYAQELQDGHAHEYLIRVRAEGYIPAISRVFSSQSDVGTVSYDVELKRLTEVSGTVLDVGGQPVAGAQVALKLSGPKFQLSGTPVLTSGAEGSIQLTDAQGHFQFNHSASASADGLIAVHQKGVAELETDELSPNSTIRLRPWSRIEGTVWQYNNLVTNEQVWASVLYQKTWPQNPGIELKANTDIHGHFVFDYVPAGEFQVYQMISMGRDQLASQRSQLVEVQYGTTNTIDFKGEGRPITGRFKITNPYVTPDWEANLLYMNSIPPQPPNNLKTTEAIDAWKWQSYAATRSYPLRMKPDGSFQIDEVLPGKYELRVQILDPRDPDANGYGYIADTTKTFDVPISTDRNSTAPFDIGTLDIALKSKMAPAFEATDINGHIFKLSDFHGKYVLLDFWDPTYGTCIKELPYLKQVQEKFKDRRDFVMVSLSLGRSIEDLRAFLKKNDLPWTQGYLENWPATNLPAVYYREGIPRVFLISPDGKIIEPALQSSSLLAKLQDHLE